ncbi:sodium:proton exchanger [Kibdelosporangium persicum]|uniref:Sodium/calcium exchanger membrane region n=1 Tax=Kibdelosporangium persicum TaxID=2698649 RepID=A0ABX2F739_9PSEU|nr:sodium:proton exchanger [Kibdelosporangium persicum]NRN67179.1 Sodium/calcium exchanger membrane region [Kibdelosporangium persicum]
MSAKLPVQLPLAVGVTLVGTYLGAADYLGLAHPGLPAPLAAVIFGAAIVGAAFLLSWAAEAAQMDISAGLAIALLAVVAVLPEYAVDLVFTYQAGQVFAEQGHCVTEGASPCSLALANMTGANRILVGFGWPLVVLVAGIAAARAGARAPRPGTVDFKPAVSVELAFLGIATVYSLTLPLRTSLTLVDAAVFVAIFACYAWRLAQAPAEKPDLIGVADWVGAKPATRRRWSVITLFVVAGLVILACAEHFAENLVATGEHLGVDKFLLVQWVAPLASESPELIVACLYAARLKASQSLGTLLSSKVNQWTLLVGTIPIVFALSAGTFSGLPLDGHQRVELLLTAAQSLFAVSIMLDRRLTGLGAGVLFGLFGLQFAASIVLSATANRWVAIVLSGVYIVLALGQIAVRYRDTGRTFKDGVTTPFDKLGSH